MTKKLLMGNEAIAHAALEAGVRVVAGYPGTPSSEIVETVAKERAAGRAEGVHVEWSTNEKAALELLGGASYAGARCLYTCKQMGLNVASDPLMCLNYVGVKGGLVLIVADDPGPISSQTEQDTRRFGSFSKVPVLDPCTPDQAFAMVKAAFELSERYRMPVIVRPTTRVDHASAFFDIADHTVARDLVDGGFERDPSHWVIFPRRAFEAHGEINARLPQIAREFAEDATYAAFNPLCGPGLAPLAAPDEVSARVGIVAGGVSAAYTLEALRLVEKRAAACGTTVPAYRFWQVGTPYPFPEGAAVRFAQGLERIIVFEELDSVLEDALTITAGRRHLAYDVLGKETGDTRDRGENDVDDIAARLVRFFGLEAELGSNAQAAPALPQDAQLPARPPVLCPGCPHRGSFYAIKRALGKTPAVLCGDIGCYTLGNAQPLDAVDTCLCMGAGITQAQGFSVVEPGRKAIAYVGDSTFFASGMTGVANAAYNGHDITVVVLDNATTAMTGAQPHPGTGVTLMGPRNEPISIESVLSACNFKKIVHADPLDLDAAIAAAHEAIFYEGPSAVLFESPCIQLIRPQAPVEIDHDVCTGCKRCITEIGCPGIGFDSANQGPKSGKRGTAFVDAGQCNGCGLCVKVCPFSAIVPPAKAACSAHETAGEDSASTGKVVAASGFAGSASEDTDSTGAPMASESASRAGAAAGPAANDGDAANEGGAHA